MGFVSKTCAKTHLPVITHYKESHPQFGEVVALLPDGNIVSGQYDGYGRVHGISVIEDANGKHIWPDVKFILKKYYNGEGYENVGKSDDELAQGFFMATEFLDYCDKHGPFKNRAEYERAFNKYANW